MLFVNNISKKFGKTKANDHINFSVKRGEVFGLLGPNGSGKTTLISQLMGFLKPDNGEIIVSDKNVIKNPTSGRKLCSLQPQDNISLSGLTPRQAIELAGKFRKGNHLTIKRRTAKLLESLQLEKWADQPSENLSGGIRRLTTFCMAAVVPGKLVILDEPTNDVDPIRRKLLWEQVRLLASNGTTILLITHNVLEAEKSVDRLAIIHNGKIIGLGTPVQLKEDFKERLRLEITKSLKDKSINLPNYATLVQHTAQKITLSIPKSYSKQIIDWVNHLQEEKIIDEFSLSPATLEDAYLKIIKQKETNLSGGGQYVFH